MGGVVRRQKAEGRRQKAGKPDRRGQSILEYLIIVTVIIAAVLVAKGTFSTHMTSLLGTSNTKVSNANTDLSGQSPEKIP